MRSIYFIFIIFLIFASCSVLEVSKSNYKVDTHTKSSRLDSIFKGTYHHRIVIDTI